MKKYLLTTTLVASFICAHPAFARMAVSNVGLQGGIITPTDHLDISLKKLVVGGRYNVQCTIVDQNNATNPVVITVAVTQSTPLGYDGQNGDILLNGTNIGYTAGTNGPTQAHLPAVKSILEVDSTYNNNVLTITNLDQNDTITVSNCTAVAA